MTRTLRQIGEKNLLQILQSYLGNSGQIIRTFSEDCAVIDAPGEYYQLFTTDVLVENVHFKREFIPAFFLGRKGLKANLSDIAAMAGEALYFLVSIGAPADTPQIMIEEIYEGMASVSKEVGVLLIGGNLSESPVLFLDIMVFGRVFKNKVRMRSDAKVGDSIFVTGRLGAAAEGLKLLQEGFRFVSGDSVSVILPERQLDSRHVRDAILAHFDPPMLLNVVQSLGAIRGVHAMIDLSDGLASDLQEICRESKVGAQIELPKIPVHPSALHWERKRKTDPLLVALNGGEDYHLLFTASSAARRQIVEAAEVAAMDFFEIGTITELEKGVIAIDVEGRKTPLVNGFQHFKS